MMVKSGVAVLVALLFVCSPRANAQAVPFLLSSTSSRSNGMGGVSAGIVTDDPLASMMNPAQLGLQSLNTSYSFGGYYSDWSPEIPAANLSKYDYFSVAFDKGLILDRDSLGIPRMGLGFGYSRIVGISNYSYLIMTIDGLRPIIYSLSQSSDQLTLSYGVDYLVKASFGLTYKHIGSNMRYEDIGRASPNYTTDAYDFGVLFDIPVAAIISKASDSRFTIASNYDPFFDFTFGMSKNNLGGGYINNFDVYMTEPVPRYARVGMGLKLGVVTKTETGTFCPISFTWTVEANDLLLKLIPAQTDTIIDPATGLPVVRVTYDPHWEPQSGIGDIDFMNNVFFGRSNGAITTKRGWELTLFETISIRGSSVDQAPDLGEDHYNTIGLGVNCSQIIRWLTKQPSEHGSISHLNVLFDINGFEQGGGNSDFTLMSLTVTMSH